MKRPFITSVEIRNYKSIAHCNVDLTQLTFLLGQNGAGKSNFLDTFRFVSDSLKTSLDHALRDRGTIKDVRRRSGGHPTNFSLRFDFDLQDGRQGHFAFRVGAKTNSGFEVQHEECRICTMDESKVFAEKEEHYYVVSNGKVIKSTLNTPLPVALADRLYLVAMSGLPDFRPVYDALSAMEIYNLNPKAIGAMQKPDPGDLLRREGDNLASVLQQLPDEERSQINEYLAEIVQGIEQANTLVLGSQETIEFRQRMKGQQHTWKFLASSMSDGTLRALGVLVAIFQGFGKESHLPLLVGLEEPEMALHPSAAKILLRALRQASTKRQIVVTSHSPDLLDNEDIEADSILSVKNNEGVTEIREIDDAGKEQIKERLFTPGELLRHNQISGNKAAMVKSGNGKQIFMFDANEE